MSHGATLRRMTPPAQWPLSAASTAILASLREAGRPTQSGDRFPGITARELFLLGELRLVSLKQRRVGFALAIVAAAPTGRPLPPPLDTFAAALPATDGLLLHSLFEQALDRSTISNKFGDAAFAELQARGLVEDRKKMRLGLFPTTYAAPTALGLEWQAKAIELQASADTLPELAERDPQQAARLARRLGTLSLLAPNGLRTLIVTAGALGAGTGGAKAVSSADGEVDVIAASVAAFAGALDVPDAPYDGLDSKFAKAVDRAIESGVLFSGPDSGTGGAGDGGD